MKKGLQNNEDSLRGLCDNMKHTDVCIIGVPGEEREQGFENLSEETMMEDFPNLMKQIDTQAQEVQRVTNKMNPKRLIPRHIIIKMPKGKDKQNIKSGKERQLVTYKRAPMRLSADFSTETLQTRGTDRKYSK